MAADDFIFKVHELLICENWLCVNSEQLLASRMTQFLQFEFICSFRSDAQHYTGLGLCSVGSCTLARSEATGRAGCGQRAGAPTPLQPGTLLVWGGGGGFWKAEAVTRIKANSDAIAMASA